MTILGLDPGVATVGFGIITSDKYSQQLVQHGVITTAAGLPLSNRLGRIYRDTLELIEKFRPDAMAVEELFFNTNLKTGIAVSHGRGALLLAGENSGTSIYEYTPLQVKQAVTGYGRADKKQVMEMVKRLLNMKTLPKPDDAADALAIALCHARSNTSLLMADNR